jgi:hypothetical protein
LVCPEPASCTAYGGSGSEHGQSGYFNNNRYHASPASGPTILHNRSHHTTEFFKTAHYMPRLSFRFHTRLQARVTGNGVPVQIELFIRSNEGLR